jgi:sodium/bile acid cotransporter 7
MQIRQQLSKFGIDPFILSLLGVILLAWWQPQWGAASHPLHLKTIASAGISVIFFLYGIKLSPEKLKLGLKNIRLHLLIQSTTFLIFPALAWIAWMFFSGGQSNDLWLSIFFLTALPSTVSSSVVMVSIAGGNIPGAIFNASISGLIGVVMTPLMMGLVMTTSGDMPDAWVVARDLLIKVILPVIAGIMLHPYLIKKLSPFLEKLKLFDQSIILLIVYVAFCESFSNHLFSQWSWQKMLLTGFGMGVLLAVISLGLYYFSGWMGFNREDRITTLFCGSQKSLVHGTVMANVLFKGSAAGGVILLPTMIYHTIQLIVAGFISRKLGGEIKESDK